MDLFSQIFAIVIFFGIINVWFFRSSKSTIYRGSKSQTLKEEFEAYGYPPYFFYLIGSLKIICSSLLLIGLKFPEFTLYGALGMVVLMLGAIASHIKVSDPVKKSIPAILMLFMSGFLLGTELRDFLF
jgi:uncharacterized membrane protein YphA (DoxX/SURF4 family)